MNGRADRSDREPFAGQSGAGAARRTLQQRRTGDIRLFISLPLSR